MNPQLKSVISLIAYYEKKPELTDKQEMRLKELKTYYAQHRGYEYENRHRRGINENMKLKRITYYQNKTDDMPNWSKTRDYRHQVYMDNRESKITAAKQYYQIHREEILQRKRELRMNQIKA